MFGFRKRRVLKNLEHTFARLRCAGDRGVGVFAIRDIPAGIDPFKGPKPRKWIKVNLKDIAHLGEPVRQMTDDFCLVRKNGDFHVYEEGFNGLHLRWFVNHSESPNLTSNDYAIIFTTLREIKAGEELSYDYGLFDPNWRRLEESEESCGNESRLEESR